MNDLGSIFILSILIIIFFLYYESKYSQLTYVRSSVDNRQYLVRNREDKQKAADMLATIRKNLDTIVNTLTEKYKDKPRIIRLKENYNPEKISESIPNTDYTSYSVNKGEQIVFCLRSKDKQEKLTDINTIMFVAIHELAHVMTKSIGHKQEFWDNFKFLLANAKESGIHEPKDYKKEPQKYCSMKITDNPYFDA